MSEQDLVDMPSDESDNEGDSRLRGACASECVVVSVSQPPSPTQSVRSLEPILEAEADGFAPARRPSS